MRLYFASRSTLDPALQRADRRRHQAVELRPERRPGRQQGHDEVLRHHQRRHRQHRLHPRQPATRRSTRSRSSTTRSARTPTLAKVVNFDGTSVSLAEQRQHRHLRLDQRPRRRDGRPHAVLRPDRRHALPALVRRRELRRPGRGQPLHRPALEHRRDRQRPGRPDLRRRAADLVHPAEHGHRHVLRQRPDLLHPQRPELACTGAGSPPTAAIIGGIENTVDRRQHHLEQHQGHVPRRQHAVRRQLDQRPAAQDRLRQRRPDGHLDGRRHHASTGAGGRCSSPRCCRTSRRPPRFTSDCTGISCTFDGDRLDATATAPSSPTSGRSATATRPAARPRRRTSSATGTYDVTLTVTDDGGLTSLGDPAGLGRQAERAARPRTSPRRATSSTATSTPRTSTDSDGTIDGYAWDFGDGETGTGATPNHVYADARHLHDHADRHRRRRRDRRRPRRPRSSSPRRRRARCRTSAARSTRATSATPNVTTPTTVSAGDRLVMVLTLNASNRVIVDPDRGDRLDGARHDDVGQHADPRLHQDRDRGRRQQEGAPCPLDAAAKYTMTVADYSGCPRRGPGLRGPRRDRDPGRPHHADGRRTGRVVGRLLLGRQVGGHDRLRAAGAR